MGICGGGVQGVSVYMCARVCVCVWLFGCQDVDMCVCGCLGVVEISNSVHMCMYVHLYT